MPIFKDISSMIDMDPKGREQLGDQVSKTLSTKDEQAFKTTFTQCSDSLNATVQTREWMTKTSKTLMLNDPLYVGRTLSPWIAVVAVGAEAFAGMEPLITALTFVLAVSLFLLFDPHNLLGRWISFVARIILFADLLMMTFSIYSKDPMLIFVDIAWNALTGFLCWKKNSQWLMAQNLIRNETVRTALVQCDDTNGMRRWYELGKKETRTIASEMGLPFYDNMLEIVYKVIWLCGYYNHHIELSGRDKTIKALENKIKKNKLNEQIDEQTIDELKRQIEILENAAENNEYKTIISQLRSRITELSDENKILRGRVEDLESQISEQEELTPEELLRRQIIQLWESTLDENGEGIPMTIREIQAELAVKGTSVSIGKIQRICAEHRKEREVS